MDEVNLVLVVVESYYDLSKRWAQASQASQVTRWRENMKTLRFFDGRIKELTWHLFRLQNLISTSSTNPCWPWCKVPVLEQKSITIRLSSIYFYYPPIPPLLYFFVSTDLLGESSWHLRWDEPGWMGNLELIFSLIYLGPLEFFGRFGMVNKGFEASAMFVQTMCHWCYDVGFKIGYSESEKLSAKGWAVTHVVHMTLSGASTKPVERESTSSRRHHWVTDLFFGTEKGGKFVDPCENYVLMRRVLHQDLRLFLCGILVWNSMDPMILDTSSREELDWWHCKKQNTQSQTTESTLFVASWAFSSSLRHEEWNKDVDVEDTYVYTSGYM